MWQRSQQWRLLHHVYDVDDRTPGTGLPNVADRGPAVGGSVLAACQLIDQCVQEKPAYLLGSVGDPCIGLTDAG